MNRLIRNLLAVCLYTLISAFVWGGKVEYSNEMETFNGESLMVAVSDTTEVDLPYPIKTNGIYEYPQGPDSSALYLKRPSNIKKEYIYDPTTGEYILYERIGDFMYRPPKSYSLQDYMKYDFDRSIQNYWHQRAMEERELNGSNGMLPKLTIGGEAFSKIFGSNVVNIRPQGYVQVDFGYKSSFINNPNIPENNRRTPTFDFDQNIQMSVTGTVGEKMRMRVNYNTEASFDFENQMNIDYTGDEDEIIKKIEAGNVSLPLSGSLITGGTNLFGVKTEMQFGRLNVTTILSQHRGETQVINTEGGAQKTEFEISATEYDANRHFFLSHYFRDHYNEALERLPIINSQVTINKVEVWVTNKAGNFNESRDIIGFMDLGEHQSNIYNQIGEFGETPGQSYPENIFPYNNANRLYEAMTTTYGAIRQSSQITATLAPLEANQFSMGQDYEKIGQARKLASSEYTVNEKLGYISLSTSLNADEVLAVAFNYSIGGRTFQVGEFSTDGIESPQTLILKMLKGTTLSPRYPTWDLMMKNVYNLNAYEMQEDGFDLDVVYLDDSKGTYINYLPQSNLKGHILLNVMNLDNVNSQGDAPRDGVFDFFEGYTVLASKGKVIFPVLEPFGQHLVDSITDPGFEKKYAYTSLYDSTLTVALQDAEHNKFKLKGSYKGSSSSEIRLNTINQSPGSVKVTAGGKQLQEGLDFVVDYNLGTVSIINQGLLESGTPIQVSSESQELFSVQRKTLIGTHLNYEVSKNFNIGGTFMWMNENPLTEKVNYGEEPISNMIWGLDMAYRNESNFLTNMVDKLPFIDTKAKSTVTFEAEGAQLIPGQSNSIKGRSYIDDFESTKTPLNLMNRLNWVLASTPQKQTLFPESEGVNSVAYGYNRARIAWYTIDPLFTSNSSQTPRYIANDFDQQDNHYIRDVHQNEIFPNKDIVAGETTRIPTLNVAFYPTEKGPYNYDTGDSPLADGVNEDGTLRSPEKRWGGIMRDIQTTDFETANIEYIEFWMLDPFIYDENDTHEGGDLYFNLGNISEDILKDSRIGFENGLPKTELVENVDETAWGRVSTLAPLTDAFDAGSDTRQRQDVGLDGLGDADENSFFADYLQRLQTILNPEAMSVAEDDPSNDNYRYFRDQYYDGIEAGVLERYKAYNNMQGNSPDASGSFSSAAYDRPDIEDVNDDNTMSEYESYYQYHISMRKEDFEVGKNFIADKITTEVDVRNPENPGEVTWYQFRVPISEYEEAFGNISDFKSIRFMRMFMRGFKEDVVLRFATMNLVRADWRRYQGDLLDPDAAMSPDTEFETSAVNIEENSNKKPVNYILPEGIDRAIDPANPQLKQLNEQSMVLKVKDLNQGDARAAYKSMNLDMRRYRNIKMDVHAEEIDGYPLSDDELHVFMRLGSDFTNNYYEYEIPLKLTKPGFYNGDLVASRREVWPIENRFDFQMDVLTDLKLARNAEMRQAGSTLRITDIFEAADPSENNGKNIVRVKGNPNLANVRVLMIGIRNPKTGLATGPRAVEAWVNELRLGDIDNEGGWAAQGRVTARLADLGSVTVSGKVVTAGFGSIDQGVNERTQDNLKEYDISSNLELGRFFPEESGVKIPMYVGYSKSIVTPEYNPLDPDIKLDKALANVETKEEKDSISNIAEDYTTRKSINFTNVRIEKPNKKGKPKVYDVSNFSATYSYNELYRRNVDTEYDLDKTYRAMLGYNFNTKPKSVTPFRSSKLLKGKAFRIIKDFNFNLSPTQISYRTDLYRHYNEVRARNISDPDMIIESTFDKEFLWNKYFDLKYDITRSLRLDFSNQSTARIDEPYGRINKDDDDYSQKRDSIMENLWKGGRPVNYQHSINVRYALPINKLPGLDWTTTSVNYRANYFWEAGPVTEDDVEYGNTIENNNSITLTGGLNFDRLYNKVGFLKKLNNSFKSRSSKFSYSNRRTTTGRQSSSRPEQEAQKKEKKVEYKTVEYKARNVDIKANEPVTITHNLRSKTIEARVKDAKGRLVRGKVAVIDENKISYTTTRDVGKASFELKGKREIKKNVFTEMARYTGRLMLSVRRLSLTYNESGSTILPGFLPEPKFWGGGSFTPERDAFGAERGKNYAPGLPFMVGWQQRNFARKAAEKGWLTTDTTRADNYRMTKNEVFNFRLNLLPINNLRVDLTTNRTYSKNISERYRFNKKTSNFDVVDLVRQGSFSMSVNTIGTSFNKIGDQGADASATYNDFLGNRRIIAGRLAAQRVPNAAAGYSPTDFHSEYEGYPSGYGPTSQEVLIPAFLAAYTDQDPNSVSLSPFPSLKHVRPNWRISYEGRVARIEGLNKVLKSLNFRHEYRSTYSVGSYISNLNYDPDRYNDGFSYFIDQAGNFAPQYDINSVSIIEQFSPLINIDAIWINDLSTQFEVKRSRSLMLNFANNQLTEQLDNEYILGFGYRFTGVDMFIKTKGAGQSASNDLNLNLDFSYRITKTTLRKIVEGIDDVLNGYKTFGVKAYAEYLLSNRLNVKVYFNKDINDPIKQENAYYRADTEFGFSFKFSLTK
ncbi:cell surface protein SprA [Puteibacter caeruleilacunae]|nr:cell surface protein SprA [Puteibacter caeruleilacunae]